MDTKSLSIPFSNTSSSSVPGIKNWVKLIQVELGTETASIAETANLIDTLYDINPCTNSVTVGTNTGTDLPDTNSAFGSATKSEDPTKEEIISAASSSFGMDLCTTDESGNWRTSIKVVTSDREIPYTLRLTNGTSYSSIRQKEKIKQTFSVSETTYVDLPFPILGDQIKMMWNGTVATTEGFVDGPSLTYVGTTVYWDGEVTGSLTVEWQTVYDVESILVNGTVSGELGKCDVICFYDGLVTQASLEKIVDADDEEWRPRLCIEDPVKTSDGATLVSSQDTKPWVTVETEWRCECTDNHSHYTYSSGPSAAQRNSGLYSFPGTKIEVFGGWVYCGTKQSLSTVAFYEEKCCDPPDGMDLPNCAVKYYINGGGYNLSDLEMESLKTKYGDRLSVVSVVPEDGYCGKITEKQNVLSRSCCEDVGPMEWDNENSVDVIPTNSSGTVFVLYGIAPYTWKTSSSTTSFENGSRSIVTDGPSVTIFTDEDFCGYTAITVSDGCSTVTELVRSNAGSWVWKGQGCVLPYHKATDYTSTGSGATWNEFASVGRYRQHQFMDTYPYTNTPHYQQVFNMYFFPRDGYTPCSSGCLGDGTRTPCDCLVEAQELRKQSEPYYHDLCMYPLDPYSRLPDGFNIQETCIAKESDLYGLYRHRSGHLYSYSCEDAEGNTRSGWQFSDYGVWYINRSYPVYEEWECGT